MTEPPEHRACRSVTTRERRGVESALRQWRPGDSNANNVYIGNEHVGVFFNPSLTAEVVRAMNGDPERDERLRAEGRCEANNAITWDTTCLGCASRLDGLYAERMAGYDDALREIAEFVDARYPETGERVLLEVKASALARAATGPGSPVRPQQADPVAVDANGSPAVSAGSTADISGSAT